MQLMAQRGFVEYRSVQLVQDPTRAKQISWLGVVTIVGATYWLISVVLLHALRTDYDPIGQNQIGDYATGSYGYLMSAAFIVWGVGIAALALGLWLAVTPRPRAGSIIVLIAGIAIIVAGIFPGEVDRPTSGSAFATTSGAIHDLSSLIFFLFMIIAMFVMARRFKKDATWRQVQRLSFWLGVASAVSLIVFVFGPIPASVDALGEKVFVFWLLSWVMLTGFRLLFVARGSTGPSTDPA